VPELISSKSDVTGPLLSEQEEQGDKGKSGHRVGEGELEKQRWIQINLGNMPPVREVVAEGRKPEEQNEPDGDIVRDSSRLHNGFILNW
jgi:hypothetical protein